MRKSMRRVRAVSGEPMSKKLSKTIEGELYYSIQGVAKLLQTTPGKVRELIVPEGWDWMNAKTNGLIWISARSIEDYIRRMKAASTRKSSK